jgi:hypothetical protein
MRPLMCSTHVEQPIVQLFISHEMFISNIRHILYKIISIDVNIFIFITDK